jgi:hypothetical protein
MEKELKVIEVPASGNPDWYDGAYCLVFVYSKYKGNFVVKGYRGEVEKYLKDNYTHYFANYTLWSSYGFRSIWRFWNDNYHIYQPDRRRQKPDRDYPNKPHYKWRLHNYSKENKISLEFRRFPKRWIKEFDNLK